MELLTAAARLQQPRVSHPLRVQLSKINGFRTPRGAIRVTGETIYGSPWRTVNGASIEDRQGDVERFRCWLVNGPESPHWIDSGNECDWNRWGRLITALPQLRGKQLADVTPLEMPSHADVLAELANGSALPFLRIAWDEV